LLFQAIYLLTDAILAKTAGFDNNRLATSANATADASLHRGQRPQALPGVAARTYGAGKSPAAGWGIKSGA
jgi:hypothetical protein